MTDLIDRAKEALEGATPGPYEVNEGTSLNGQYHTIHAGHLMVAECWDNTDEIDAANARLIALAPDLVRLAVAAGDLAEAALACHPYVEELRCGDDLREALARFRAIAEGRE
jgi:hypothetical protein